MEIVIETEKVLDALEKISRVLPSKPVISATGGILVEGKKDGITLISTDLQLTLRLFVECDVKDKSTVLIPGKNFISLIKKIPEQHIKITAKENSAVISDKSFLYKFLLMNVEEYPKLPAERDGISESEGFIINSSILLDMIKKTVYCINPDEPRMYFRGVLMEKKNNTLNMVATDTRRLSLVKKEVQGENTIKIILPLHLIEVFPLVFKETDVSLSFSKNQITIKTERTTLISQLLEGEFPDYEKVIPSSNKQGTATIKTDDLLQSLERLSLMSSEKFISVRMNFRKNLLVLNIESPESGSGEERINIEYTGPENTVIFNPEYIIQFLKTVSQEHIEFFFQDPAKPAKLCGKGEQEYLYVAMPMKP
ncbi:MAG: DNA polymerase III subunit beta [Candidatus Omnitrophica bacterium]|nr:DNA polymerase III subunit beta [Candidatus Omnitrophota bacterium]MCM8788242.1 DNA polymerase III subunit beta [Candidatus Omnitrophota bacterium]